MKNRLIKFRAWDSNSKYFKPIEDDGDYYFRDDGDGLCLYDKWGECKNVILLQFIGLKDKNGEEIYEGDIIQDGDKIRQVKFNSQNASFYMSTQHVYKEFIDCGQSQADGPVHCDTIEVIGNIHENPELITPNSSTQ